MLRRSTTAAACAVALLALGAAPATALTQPVAIAVLVASVPGPDPAVPPLVKAYAVEAVVPGAGPELTADDFVVLPDGPVDPDTDPDSVSDPAAFCGSVEVDVDPEAQTVTATAPDDDVDCEIGLLNVTVLSPEIASFTVESDEVLRFEPDVDGSLEGEQAAGTVSATWAAADDQVLVLTSGTTVFRYELVAAPDPEPVTPVTPPPAAPAPAPAPAPAAPARPVVAQPTFTG